VPGSTVKPGVTLYLNVKVLPETAAAPLNPVLASTGEAVVADALAKAVHEVTEPPAPLTTPHETFSGCKGAVIVAGPPLIGVPTMFVIEVVNFHSLFDFTAKFTASVTRPFSISVSLVKGARVGDPVTVELTDELIAALMVCATASELKSVISDNVSKYFFMRLNLI
jgi:hypothetical protein